MLASLAPCLAFAAHVQRLSVLPAVPSLTVASVKQKTFIVATLCSTLIGTFTSSMGLWDRVSDRRKQKKIDGSQNNEIQELRNRVEKAEKASKEASRSRDELGDNFERSGALIQRQFDEGYGRLGKRFAVGDSKSVPAFGLTKAAFLGEAG